MMQNCSAFYEYMTIDLYIMYQQKNNNSNNNNWYTYWLSTILTNDYILLL